MNESQHSIVSESIYRTLTRVRKLSRRQVRDSEKCFWFEGVRNFVQACDAGITFESLVYAPILLQCPLAEKLIRRLSAKGISRVKITPEQFRSISTAERASGVGGIARQHWARLQQITNAQGIGWLVIEEIRNAGNLGTILRTAEATGVRGILFVGPKCDPFDPVCVRGSMGGLFHLPLVRITHEELRRWVLRERIELVGLSPQAELAWTDLPSVERIGLTIGEERAGLSPALAALCTKLVRLPMTGHADSLNVGVAAGVMMYELVRRHQSTVIDAT